MSSAVLAASLIKSLKIEDEVFAPAPVVVVRNQTHFIVTTLGLRFGGS
jgi:hypothetical protein